MKGIAIQHILDLGKLLHHRIVPTSQIPPVVDGVHPFAGGGDLDPVDTVLHAFDFQDQMQDRPIPPANPDDEIRNVLVGPPSPLVGNREAETVVSHVAQNCRMALQLHGEVPLPDLGVAGDVADVGANGLHAVQGCLKEDTVRAPDRAVRIKDREEPGVSRVVAADGVGDRLGDQVDVLLQAHLALVDLALICDLLVPVLTDHS